MMTVHDLPMIHLERAVCAIAFHAPDRESAVAAMDAWIAAVGLDDDSPLADRLWGAWAVGATAAGLLPIAVMH